MSKNGTVMRVCERCRNLKLHHARGCCKCCYNKVILRGLQHLFPTMSECPSRSAATEPGPRTLGRPGLHTWKQGGLTQ